MSDSDEKRSPTALAPPAVPASGKNLDHPDLYPFFAEAQRLGTFEISIIPDQDCCTLFTPRHPLTKARAPHVAAAGQVLPVTASNRGGGDEHRRQACAAHGAALCE